MRIRKLKTFVAFVLFLASAVAGAEESCRWADTKVAKVLGGDFVSPEQVAIKWGVVYSDTQLKQLCDTVPTTNKEVWWLKLNDYVFMPAPPRPMSLAEMRDVPSSGDGDRTTFGWLPIKKKPFKGSLGESWETQRGLLSEKNERPPNDAEAFWVITSYFRVRGIRLFEKFFVRTNSVDSSGNRVLVGLFTGDSPNVCGCSGDILDAKNVGITSATQRRK